MRKANAEMSVRGVDRRFKDDESVLKHLEQLWWNGKPFCPRCNSAKVYKLCRNSFLHCNGCKKQFNILTGTVFQHTKVPLSDWLYAIGRMSNYEKGISARQLGKDIGISYASAMLMCHKIRHIMGCDKYGILLEGVVECDETIFCEKARNKHRKKKKPEGDPEKEKEKKPRKINPKAFGIIERGGLGRVLTFAIDRTTSNILLPLIQRFVKPGSVVNTDEYASYKRLPLLGYRHRSVNHSAGLYAAGGKSTNSIESVWKKRKDIYRTHGRFSRRHLQRYLDEADFRHNHRNETAMEKAGIILKGCFGRRMTYRDLVGK